MAKTSFYSGSGATSNDVDAVDGLKTAAETAQAAAETAKSGADTSAANAATSATAAAASAASINSYTGGTGITVSGTTITNDSPDQTVALTAGSNVSVSGTYPNFTISATDTNTTYSVGDNGLTEKNFTTALKNKLDAVEANATADQSNAEIRAAVEAATDSNVFTDADHSKLGGIATSANNYSLPTASGSTLGGIKIGSGLSIDGSGVVTGGSSLTVQDEGTALSTDASSLDFVGAAVTASGTGADKTITISSDAANLTGTLPAISGANLTNVQAASVNVTESSDDNVNYNILFSDTNSAGTVQMTPTQDDDVLTFNPSTNYLYSPYAQHQQVGIDSYLYHNGDANTYLVFDANDSIKLGTSGTAKLHITNSGLDVTGNITVTGTVDGVDVAARDAVLTSTTTTANAAMPTSGGTFTGDISFEGATANDYETTVTVADPTADRTITLPDASGTVLLSDGDGSNLTNVEASKVYINEVSDSLNDVDLNVLFSDTSGSGNVQMQPQQDDGGLTFNPDQNILKVNNIQVQDVSSQSGHLYLRNLHDNYSVIIQTDNGSGGATNYFKADGSTGEAGLYHYGNSKLKTQSGGVDITGDITVSGTVDGRDIATDGTKLDGVAASANNYVHPNHSGEVTSTADGAMVIADNMVDEANLKVSNSPTNGYVLTAQSGDTGGLTWAAASGGGGSPDLYAENYTSGTKPTTTGTNAVAIGKGSSAAGTEAIALVDGTADSQDSFAVGGIVQSAIGGYAIGKSAQVYSQYGLALGQSSLVSASSYGTAVGYQAVAGAYRAVGLAKSRASGADSLAGAVTDNSTSYGALAANSIALGQLAKASAANSIAIGDAATSTTANLIALGGTSDTVKISGAYSLPTSDGTSGQVLSTDGNGNLSWVDP